MSRHERAPRLSRRGVIETTTVRGSDAAADAAHLSATAGVAGGEPAEVSGSTSRSLAFFHRRGSALDTESTARSRRAPAARDRAAQRPRRAAEKSRVRWRSRGWRNDRCTARAPTPGRSRGSSRRSPVGIEARRPADPRTIASPSSSCSRRCRPGTSPRAERPKPKGSVKVLEPRSRCRGCWADCRSRACAPGRRSRRGCRTQKPRIAGTGAPRRSTRSASWTRGGPPRLMRLAVLWSRSRRRSPPKWRPRTSCALSRARCRALAACRRFSSWLPSRPQSTRPSSFRSARRARLRRRRDRGPRGGAAIP
jgi:hypothetical protein